MMQQVRLNRDRRKPSSKALWVTELLLLLLLVINVFSQSFLNAKMPVADLFVSLVLFLYLIYASRCILRLSRAELFYIVVFLIFSVLALALSEDRAYTVKRLLTLFTQSVTLMLLAVSLSRACTGRQLAAIMRSNIIKYALVLLAAVNILLMALGRALGVFELGGIEVGNYISQRYYGFQNTPAFASGLSLCLLYCGFSSRRWVLRGISLAAVAATFLLSESRAGLVAIVAFLLAFLFLSVDRGKNAFKLILIGAVCAGILGIVLINVKDLNEISSYRIELWEIAIKNTKPLFGNALAFMHIQTPTDIYEGGAHNTFIQLLYTCGWPLTVALLSIVFYKLLRALRGVRQVYLQAKDYFREYIALLSLSAGILAFCMFESHLFYVRCTVSFMFFYALYRIEIISRLVGKKESV